MYFRVYVSACRHFVSFRNSQIELRSTTDETSKIKILNRLWRARSGLLRATKQSAFFAAKTFLFSYRHPLPRRPTQPTEPNSLSAGVPPHHLTYMCAHDTRVAVGRYIHEENWSPLSAENKSIETLKPPKAAPQELYVYMHTLYYT